MITSKKPIKISYIITSLNCGGAETMLLKLVSNMSKDPHYSVKVFSLLKGGDLICKFDNHDIDVYSFGFSNNRFVDIRLLVSSLIEIIRFNPNIIHSWMYHANVLAFIIKVILFGKVTLIWGIRQTIYNLSLEKKATKRLIKISVFFSRFADFILYNSGTSKLQHEKIGYRSSKALIIYNGFNVNNLPKYKSKNNIRLSLGVPDKCFLIGCVARYHPMKGHKDLISSFSKFNKVNKYSKLILIGNGVDNETIKNIVQKHKLNNSVILLGYREDVLSILTELDLFCFSSKWGEAFPNALGEAMSIGIPCVATNIGDIKYIMGNCGSVIEPGDINLMYSEMIRFYNMSNVKRFRIGHMCKDVVIKRFSIESIVNRHKLLYEKQY